MSFPPMAVIKSTLHPLIQQISIVYYDQHNLNMNMPKILRISYYFKSANMKLNGFLTI